MKTILRIVFIPLTLIRFILLIGVSFILLLVLFVENALCRESGSFKFISARIWGHAILFIFGFIVYKNKIPKTGSYLLMPNHRSYLDIFLMSALSPSAFVAKAELLKWPIVGPALRCGKAITVQRNDMKSLLGTMKKIQDSINNNISITIFPEGTTAHGPELLPFKNGTFKIAAELGIPIIPCAIEYADKNNSWVSDDTLIKHIFRQLWKPLSFVHVRFGNPIINNDFNVLKHHTKTSIETMLKDINSK